MVNDILSKVNLNIITFATFYLGWFVVVTNPRGITAILTAALAILNIFVLKLSFNQIAVWILISMIGFSVDYILLQLKVIKVKGLNFNIPFWLIALWFLFASLYFGPMEWFIKLPIYIVALLGAIGGGFSYIAAMKMKIISYKGKISEYVFFPILLGVNITCQVSVLKLL